MKPDRRLPSARGQATELILHKLMSLAPIGAAAAAVIASLNGLQVHRPDSELVTPRTPVTPPRFLVVGWAARVRWMPDGRRQIVGFVLPGDALGLQARSHPIGSCTTIALTRVETLDATPVHKAVMMEGHARSELAEAARAAANLEEYYLLDQVLRLGRQTAYERICHLFMEIQHRLMTVGLATETQFPLPLTQETLADSTGLSIVHVNRILQQLRREELLSLRNGIVTLRRPDVLSGIADYRPPDPSPWLHATSADPAVVRTVRLTGSGSGLT